MGTLSLPGLASISPQVAKAISLYEPIEPICRHGRSKLALDGLTHISDEVAYLLSQTKRRLSMRGLRSISESLAERLYCRSLSQNHLTELSVGVAKIFATCPGMLSLRGLKYIPDEVAAILGTHVGDLDLFGLNSLTEIAAKGLSMHRDGELCLGGLTSLSDECAKAFENHKGSLRLLGLTSISQSAAQSLLRHADEVRTELDLKKFAETPEDPRTCVNFADPF